MKILLPGIAEKTAKEKAELFEEIGELKMQIKWLKKKFLALQ